MNHSDEYRQFAQQLLRDMARLEKQYKAFEEIQNTLRALKAAAPNDPTAARNLEKINALHNDANFQSLCQQAEKDLRLIGRHIDSLDKQFAQAESEQSAPAPPLDERGDVKKHSRLKRHKPQFV
ncbi:MAG TPA: hypothetical protein VGL07_13345 [Buttiauxella sp.]|jgi:hypothetical protein